jgi:glycosyltransferase involved in cell wall biosynthesis
LQTEAVNKIKLYPLYLGNAGCDYHRVKLPCVHGAGYMDDSPYQDFDVNNLLKYIDVSELVVFNRSVPFTPEQIKKYQAKGIKFAADLDDWVELPWYHPLYKQYKTHSAKTILDAIRAADVVTVTTDRLYQKIKEFNRNTHVIPNALPFGLGQFRPHPAPPLRETDDFNFVYAGQSSHLEDVRLMQSQIIKLKTIPGMTLTMAGYKSHKIWDQMEMVFKNLPGYRRLENLPLEKYMMAYDGMDCSLVPLCVNEFNACKSNLKLLEAAAKKIPVIVSHVPPYRDDSEAPVLWVREPADWYKHMKFFVENPDLARQMGEDLYQWAFKKYNLADWNKVRFEIYQRTVEK